MTGIRAAVHSALAMKITTLYTGITLIIARSAAPQWNKVVDLIIYRRRLWRLRLSQMAAVQPDYSISIDLLAFHLSNVDDQSKYYRSCRKTD